MPVELAKITARIINRRFSKAALAVAAREMEVPMASGGDIFQAMIDAGKASDFNDAVRLVAAHLDKDDADGHFE